MIFDSLKGVVSGKLKTNFRKVVIDDVFFKMHYRITFTIMLMFVILVTQRQYIGEHIKCIADQGVIEQVINTYCFFSGTYTVVKHLNESDIINGNIPHPGVGPADFNEDETIHHSYYQWVPFVLFIQALSFYVPYALWKSKEGGRLNALANGLRLAYISECDKDEADTVIAEDYIKTKIGRCKLELKERITKLQSWANWLVFCEFLNLLNLIIQIYITDLFLNGRFMGIGSGVANTDDWDGYLDPLDVVFPKVTKCTYYKYGPSATIQNHDALCVMALNVIHEKIYTILWFWYAILFSTSILALLNRLIMFIFHSRSLTYNKTMFTYACPMSYENVTLKVVQNKFTYAGWVFIFYLGKNMSPYAFKKFLQDLVDESNEADTLPRKEKLGSKTDISNQEQENLI